MDRHHFLLSFHFVLCPGHHKLHGAAAASDAVHVSPSGASGEQLGGATHTKTQQVRSQVASVGSWDILEKS